MQASETYREGLQRRQQEAALLGARERRISLLRLVVVAGGVAAALLSWVWLVVGLGALFILLMVMHERMIRRRRRAERGAAFFQRGLDRLQDRWQGEGFDGAAFAEDHHPYAGDLDLFGRGSLYQWMCGAVSPRGRSMLASWLKEPLAEPERIRERQQAAQELRQAVALREELSATAEEVRAEIEEERLEAWGAQPPVHFALWERMAALLLPAVTIVLVVMAVRPLVQEALRMPADRFPAWPLLIAAALQLMLARHLGERVGRIILTIERAEPALALLARLLRIVERQSFTSPRLQALHAVVGSDAPASARIDLLRRRVALLDARRNQFFAPIGMLMLWTTNAAMLIEGWRRREGSNVNRWINAVAEIESLLSFAALSFENPHFVFPEIVSSSPCFDARALGHPLIPAARRVTNDLRLDSSLQLLIISGSNMSGKSTMMRSAGVAAVLGLAGGPVCAQSMRISPMRIGASIRINDSLQEGSSRFYAEILRLRQILELADGHRPLLFLLDEILHGTNSHDRRIGAEGVIRSLVQRGAAGLVSTHDLALAEIVSSLGARARNVHFEDHLEEGQMVFDYRMREGVVTKSNALALMRSVGIEL